MTVKEEKEKIKELIANEEMIECFKMSFEEIAVYEIYSEQIDKIERGEEHDERLLQFCENYLNRDSEYIQTMDYKKRFNVKLHTLT